MAIENEPRERTRRRPGRPGGETRTTGGLKQLPWRRLVNSYRPIEVLTDEQIERIHDASMRVLETIGMDFLLD